MLATDTLTDAQWQIADAIARQLVIEGTDVNELRKAIAYLRAHLDRADAGKKFFDYLKTLVRHGNSIGHSKRTIDYYRSLDAICSQYLSSYQDDTSKMLFLLGWAARLVQYYDKGVPTGEIERPEIKSEREAELQAVAAANTFRVGQTLEATIKAIKTNKITYEILGTIRLTQKEPKLLKNCTLAEGQMLKVKITALKNGSIKKVEAECPANAVKQG
ncbi:MAG: hypothetical protein AAGF01_11920 [Cyanobacteria bacterium P01_G01_bin.38]